MMRLFAAIELSDEMRTALYKVQQSLKRMGVRGSFTPKENLHLTLRFFGEGDPQRLKDALSRFTYPAARLKVEGAGCFMNGTLLYAKLQKEEGLMAMQALCEQAAQNAGYEREGRSYTPHITLCRRMQAPKGADVFACCKSALGVTMKTEGFSLMESKLGPRGAVYVKRAAFLRAGKEEEI